jgi:hypothetical protein
MEERITVELRVASCVQEHHVPARTDLESLQNWVDPSDRERDPIEQACIVIIDDLCRTRSQGGRGRRESLDFFSNPPLGNYPTFPREFVR